MPITEVTEMILKALRAMAIGLPGVFLVLAVFYIVLKLLMTGKNRNKEE